MVEGLRLEIWRKIVHIAFGFGALLLRWLMPWEAAALALAALLHNRFVLPRVFGKRISRDPRGVDVGILLYPFVIFVVILAFPRDPGIAAAIWAILAFGDGFATLAGLLLRGPRLPWNHAKTISGTLAFILAGGTAAALIARFVDRDPGYSLSWVALATAGAIACAIAESLPLHVDDNLIVPLVGALVVFPLSRLSADPMPDLGEAALLWLGANAVLAVAGWVARSVTLSGAIGGFLLGGVLILFAGWELFAVLLAFFIIGTAATKLGYRKKAAAGLAQEKGGRRGFTHAWSNVGVSAILALYIAGECGPLPILWIGAIAALATAAADTVASEIGQLAGRRTFLATTFRRVPRGTEGAISIEGTVAGALAGMLVGAVGVWLAGGRLELAPGPALAVITLAAVAGSYLESLIGNWNRKRAEPVPNGALNFLNTLAGAAFAMLAAWLW